MNKIMLLGCLFLSAIYANPDQAQTLDTPPNLFSPVAIVAEAIALGGMFMIRDKLATMRPVQTCRNLLRRCNNAPLPLRIVASTVATALGLAAGAVARARYEDSQLQKALNKSSKTL